VIIWNMGNKTHWVHRDCEVLIEVKGRAPCSRPHP
jgi:hypothetical protein